MPQKLNNEDMNANEEFYIPESYITKAMVKEIMEEFTWPVPYELEEDKELEDTINIKFPTCEIQLYDVPESGTVLTFLTYDNGKKLDATYKDVVYYDCIENYNPEEHLELERGYTDRVDETRKNIRNDCKNLLYYHTDFIKGTGYSWVERYLKRKE